MFDFRYHALSLVAVFVALAIGLLLGVAIGDAGLVSGAETDLRRSLRGDVEEARAESAALREELERRERYERQTFPALVGGRLDNRRVALVFVGDRSDDVFDGVSQTVRAAGGELRFVTTLRSPVDVEALDELATGTRVAGVAGDEAALAELGERAGTQLVRGGRLVGRLRPELLASSNGELGPVEAVVVARAPAADDEQAEGADAARALAAALVRGMRRARVPVVGVETVGTQPSQVEWYVDHGLASVDNVEQVPGMVSLAFALTGGAEGHYGVKPTRDALLPDAVASPGGAG